ncbi:MAG: zf-HC2 domain-containing protein [Actinomycetota bacterium]
MDCYQLVELITAYFDGALDATTQTRFEEHLLGCDGCATYLQQFRATVHTLSTICEEDVAPEFRDRLLDAFRDWR